MSIVDAIQLHSPKLTFAKDLGHTSADAWRGLNQYGPYDNSRVTIQEKSILFVFPASLRPLAKKLALGLEGRGGFRQPIPDTVQARLQELVRSAAP